MIVTLLLVAAAAIVFFFVGKRWSIRFLWMVPAVIFATGLLFSEEPSGFFRWSLWVLMWGLPWLSCGIAAVIRRGPDIAERLAEVGVAESEQEAKGLNL